MNGTSIWLTKDRRKVLSKVLSGFYKRKLESVSERYIFEELKKQIMGEYKRW